MKLRHESKFKEETRDARKGEITMRTTRLIEIFSTGCQICEDTVSLVQNLTCPSCQVTVLDMKDQAVSRRAKQLEIHTIPAVVVDGKMADCCGGTGPSETALRAAGVWTPLP
jgi:glutaredoxin 3